MFSGRIVEMGSVAQVYGATAHPYTRMLLDAAPVPDPILQRERLRSTPPEPRFPSGDSADEPCAWGERHATSGRREWHEVAEGHGVSCRFWPQMS
jgi:oligopeptide/dipeptide ABC transporter ATP-binding protein